MNLIGSGSLFECSEAEKRLIAAIIKQGFLDLHSTKQKLRDDAVKWLQSENAYRYAEILGLDGEVLLRGVRYHLKQIGVECKVDAERINSFRQIANDIRPNSTYDREVFVEIVEQLSLSFDDVFLEPLSESDSSAVCGAWA